MTNEEREKWLRRAHEHFLRGEVPPTATGSWTEETDTEKIMSDEKAKLSLSEDDVAFLKSVGVAADAARKE